MLMLAAIKRAGPWVTSTHVATTLKFAGSECLQEPSNRIRRLKNMEERGFIRSQHISGAKHSRRWSITEAGLEKLKEFQTTLKKLSRTPYDTDDLHKARRNVRDLRRFLLWALDHIPQDPDLKAQHMNATKFLERIED